MILTIALASFLLGENYLHFCFRVTGQIGVSMWSQWSNWREVSRSDQCFLNFTLPSASTSLIRSNHDTGFFRFCSLTHFCWESWQVLLPRTCPSVYDLVLSNITMSYLCSNSLLQSIFRTWWNLRLASQRGSQPNWSFSMMNQNPLGLYPAPCWIPATKNEVSFLKLRCFYFLK